MKDPGNQLWRRLLIASSFLLVAGMLGGCGIFSPTETKDPPAPTNETYPLATTRDQLIENFVAAHNDRRIDEYDKILHADFEFIFATEDIDASGTPDGEWNRAIDYGSTERMFAGEEGKLDPDTGRVQPPVQSIVLSLSPVDSWTDNVPAETESDFLRRYTVNMVVTYNNLDTATVTGIQEFYVKQVEVSGQQVFQLRRWADRGQDSGG